MTYEIELNLTRGQAETILCHLYPNINSVVKKNLNTLPSDKIKDFIYRSLRHNKKESLPKAISLDFYTHNTKKIDTNMSHLQGELRVGYRGLSKVFGEPMQFDGDKVDWEWVIERDGVVATIYNWKNGPNYGYQMATPEDIKTWNIGGYSSKAVELVKSILLINGIKS